ncbi:MAG: recombinase RecT [Burkholderiales bacterium]|nr:recombinase RecT [Burkholderiales bacterium]
MTQPKTQNALQVLEMQFVERRADFQAILPGNCTFERFTRIVKTASIQTPDLLKADRASLFMSCFKAAQDGLLPDGREAALVIYKTKQKDGSYKQLVQYMPMVNGLIKKMHNSGEITNISAHVVYDNDEFDYCLGDEEHITHKPSLTHQGKPLCAYAIAKTKDKAIYREVMIFAEIEKIRSMSMTEKAKKKYPDIKSIWDEHWSEMAKKTVIRRLSKRLPMSTDLEQVIHGDDALFEFETKPKPVINAIDTINRQVIDISTVNSSEIDSSGEQFTEQKATEDNGDVDISPEIVAKADKFYKEMNNA